MRIEKQPRELKNPYRKRWYEKRKAQHRCILCGAIDAETLAGRVRCGACSEAQRRKYAAFSASRPRPERHAPQTAEERKAKQREALDALRARRRAEHRCRECGAQDSDTLSGHYRCAACREYRRRKKAMRKENQ